MLSTTLNLFGLMALLSLFFCLVMMAVFVVHNKWSRLSNRMLFLALFSFAIACFVAFALYDSDPGSGRGVVLIMSASTMLIMPFSYLYLRKWPAERWSFADTLHFFPALIYLLIGIASWSGLESAPEEAGTNRMSGIDSLSYSLRAVQWFVYAVVMIYEVTRLKLRASQSEFSKRPVWLNVVVGSFVITSIVPALATTQSIQSGEILFYGFVVATAFVLCIYMLLNPSVLYGIQPVPESKQPNESLENADVDSQAEHHVTNTVETEAGTLPTDETSKAKRISLSEEQIEFMHKRLHEFMLIRKPFLHQKYTLQQLSSDSGFPLYQLSLYLNRSLGMNFNSYINKMRIEFLLESYKRNQEKWNRYTLEAVAREIGFNNRTSFIQAFKKVTGTNPSVYFKNIHGHILKD